MFFDKRDLSFMSRTAITSKMRWFPNEERYVKLQSDINLVPLMPDEDETFRGSLAC